jgi:hypothetical protein
VVVNERGGIRKRVGRGERIRTSDLSVPNRAHYQAVLRPELTCERCLLLWRLDILATARSDGQALQVVTCLVQGAGSVADLIFDFRLQFPKR